MSTQINPRNLFDQILWLVLPFLPDADTFLHIPRLSCHSLKTVEANHSAALLLYHLPYLNASSRSEIRRIAATQPNSRQFYTKLYIRIQMATQRIFDPISAHREHFDISNVPCESISSNLSPHRHQPHSFRSLPCVLQQLLVELCMDPSDFVRSRKFDSINQSYDLTSFLGISMISSLKSKKKKPVDDDEQMIWKYVASIYNADAVSAKTTMPEKHSGQISSPTAPSLLSYESAYESILSCPVTYEGIRGDQLGRTNTEKRALAYENFQDGGNGDEMFPTRYCEWYLYDGIEHISHVDSCSNFSKNALPDSWLCYLIDLMRNRILWIGATLHGEFIGLAHKEFDTFSHRGGSMHSSICMCQNQSYNSSNDDWNGPVILWDWSKEIGEIFASSLSNFLHVNVQNDYVLINDLHNSEYGYRANTIKEVKQSTEFEEWQDYLQQMKVPPLSVTYSEAELETSNDRIFRKFAELSCTTLNAYLTD